MFEKVKTAAANALQKGKHAAGVLTGTGGLAVMSIAASAEGETVTVPSIATTVTQASFNGILTQITDLLPIILPVVVAGLALRKGIRFMIGMIRGI